MSYPPAELARYPRRPAGRRFHVSFSTLLYAFYCAGFVLVGGGFVLYTSLSSDPRMTRDITAGSPFSQAILAAFYSIAVLLLLSSGEARKVLRVAWPVLLLPALAILSMAWSPDPELTLRRAIAFSGTILFGLSLGAAYRFRDTIALITISMTLVMVISILLAFIDPLRALHQPDDVIQAVHAGAWRGIFAHRNTLGFWSGATLVLLLLAGRDVMAGRVLWAGSLLAAGICLIATGSSAGITIVVLAIAFFLMLVSTMRQPRRLRGALALFWAMVVALAYLSFEPIARYALWLLGRDSDLSGRTELWSYLFDLVQSADKPLGLGYFVGTVLLDQRLSAATQVHNVNAHNGFLEAYVYFGVLGPAIALGLVAWLAWRTLGIAASGLPRIGHLAAVPAVLVFMAVVHNMVESTIVSPNNLNNVLLSIAAAMVARAAAEKRTEDVTSRTPPAPASAPPPAR